MLLSVCLIVRNEGRLLADCLSSVQAVADQLVVVDTGSEDDTISVAQRFQAEIYHFQWCDDFAAARNFSISQARSKWILWLDADERLLPDSQAPLQEIIKHASTDNYYRLTIRNLTSEKNNYLLSTAHRLFPNKRGFKFSGQIHEMIIPPDGQKFREKLAPIVIEHLGYALPEELASIKEQRNRLLLEKVLQARPNDFLANFNYAQHLDIHGKLSQARDYYLKARQCARNASHWSAILLNNLAGLAIRTQDFSEAQQYALESIANEPHQVGAYYHLYRVAYFQHDRQGMITWLTKLDKVLQEIDQRLPRLPTDLQLDRTQVLYTLAKLYFENGQLAESRQVLERLIASAPQDRAARRLLVEVALQQSDYDLAQNHLEFLVAADSTDIPTAKRLALVLIKKRAFQQAIKIYESLLVLAPEDQEILRRLAGLYGYVGDFERSRQIVSLIK